MHPRIANVDLSTGPVSKPRCVKYRWKPIVVPNAQSTYRLRKSARSTQLNAPPQSSTMAVPSPSAGRTTATSITSWSRRLFQSRTAPTGTEAGGDEGETDVTGSSAASARPGGRDARSDVREAREVLAEHACELSGLRVVRLRIGPRGTRVEERGVDPGHGHRYLETERRVDSVFHVVEVARQRRVEQCSRRVDRHPPPLPERPSGPPRVDEPHPRLRVRVELLPEQACVHGRRLREERRAEAGRERRLRLGDADLRPGQLGREAGEEPIQRLVAREPRDRREDSERVGGEEHDRARMARSLRRERVRDLLELVRGPRVLG